MATRTVASGGGNYSSASTWSEGAVPTSADDVVFTSGSGSLTIDVASAALSINFTNFVNTVTFNADLTVSGAVNLGTGGYTQAGSFGIVVNTTATLTSGGVTWSRTFNFAGNNQTYTLSGTWTITGALSFSGTLQITINSSTLNIGGNFTLGGTANVAGSTNFVFNGTGTWSHSSTAQLKNNLTINTSGTLTVSGNVYYNTGTLTYTAGTVVTTGSTINSNQPVTFSTNGINWNTVNLTASFTCTINSMLSATTLQCADGSGVTFAGTSAFTVGTWSILNTSSTSHRLVGSRTYTITSALSAVATSPTNRVTINSAQSTNKSIIDLVSPATCALGFVNLTDITGATQTIRTFGGTLSNTTNCQTFTSVQTVGG